MTQEEKAKRYDEAYKVAESIHRFSSDPAEIKRMEQIFTELKEESEDERIKNQIIEHIKWCEDGGYCAKEEMTRWISWIERQGEHANFRNKIQIGDKVTRNRDGYLVNLSQLNRVAKIDEKQGENFQILSNSSNIGKDEQNPAWSEEDKKMIEAIEALCDDKIRFTEFHDVKEYAYTIKNWLKSLRPQSHWKPSDEQMTALKHAFNDCSIAFADMKILATLYEQLKALHRYEQDT